MPELRMACQLSRLTARDRLLDNAIPAWGLVRTEHRIVHGDARRLASVEKESVELVVTSPPYPMVEMWDELFARLEPRVGDALQAGDAQASFEAMHRVLDTVWEQVQRVLGPGGIACINVGDAVRRMDGTFRAFPNHARILDAFQKLGFDPLPDILWRKPTNSPAKFVGSGMLPPSAYATLEHEYLLVFRKGSTRRSFEPNATRRYEAAFFWEERNDWFSDVWTNVQGTLQALDGDDQLRERSAAYPFEVPYRLINMYSVYGDTVLDPFWGTGTTTLAAMVAARDSVGVELEEGFIERFHEQVERVPGLSGAVLDERLDRHRAFVQERRDQGKPPSYESQAYGFPVMTKQETRLRLYGSDQVERTEEGYRVIHRPVSTEKALSASTDA